MSESSSQARENLSSRISTITTVLIALVSTVIALVAAQAATASGDATEAQHNGVIAKINLERTTGGAWAEVARNKRAFDSYRFNLANYYATFDYALEAEAAGATAEGTRLRGEASGQLEESTLAYRFVDSDYVLRDDEGNAAAFDVDNYLADQRQNAAIYQDIDYDDNFTSASQLRTQSLSLNISLLFWFVALLFFTWAELTRSWLRWVWLGAGLLVSVGILAVYALSGFAAALGLG